MSNEKMTKSEALANLNVGIPVDWSQVEGHPSAEAEPEAAEEAVDEGTDDAAEEGATEVITEAAEESPEEDSAEEEAAPSDDEPEEADDSEDDDSAAEAETSDDEWEETIRDAGGDPERDELAEANEVLSSSPVADLKADEAKSSIDGLTPLQLLATVEHDTRKSVVKAAQAALDSAE